MRRPLPAAAALSLVLFLGACVQPSPGSSPSGADGATPEASASETPTASPSSGTPATSAASWVAYKTKDGELTFDHPARWTITDPAGEAAGDGTFLSASNEAGKQLATLRTNMIAGAECTTRSPYSLLDSQPLPALAQKGSTPRFVFEGRQGSDPAVLGPFAYGITSSPAPSGPEACPIFHFFSWPPSGAAFGGAYNPMEAVEGATPGPDTPEAYMETQEYKDIKRMITSLRPNS